MACRSTLSRLRPSISSSSYSRRSFGVYPKVYPKRIRVITCDVTGTLVSFKGTLDDHYLGSARALGLQLPSDAPIASAFSQAYKDVSREYPCFGSTELTGKEWWKEVVLRSFRLAGCKMTPVQEDAVFQRIYSIFGSLAAYEKFEDASPFLNWSQRKNVKMGLLSNADERYGDSILPMLGFTPDDLQFQCFSKDLGLEKPDARFYFESMKMAEPFLDTEDDPLLPSQVMHIGNDYTKDFEGARRAGMHAVLLERYGDTERADEWKRRGAIVFEDLLDVVEFLGRCQCRYG